MIPPAHIQDGPVVAWAELRAVRIPWDQIPPDLAEHLRVSRYLCICRTHTRDGQVLGYYCHICDARWQALATSFSRAIESAKHGADRPLHLASDALTWYDQA